MEKASDPQRDNRAIIENRWPALWARLVNAPGGRTLATAANTVLADGFQLGSRIDPDAEANLLAQAIPETAPEAWLYGAGTPHLPRVLLRRPGLARLNAVILDPGLFRETLRHFDHSAWLADERVELTLVDDQTVVQRPFVAPPAMLRLSRPEEAGGRLAQRLRVALHGQFLQQRFNDHPLMAKRIAANRADWEATPGVESLFGSARGETVLVAAAGPTLADHLEGLRTLQHPVRLLAVDAALFTLLEAGVIPDLVITLEHRPIVQSLFQLLDDDLADVALVHFPASDPEVLSAWPGPRLAAVSRSHVYASLRGRFPHRLLFASGSVIHPAVDLALRMDPASVILLGADFALPGGASHPAGHPACSKCGASPNDPVLRDGFGEPVSSLHSLNSYLMDLEELIGKTSIPVLNASRRGARIAGTRYLDEVEPEFWNGGTQATELEKSGNQPSLTAESQNEGVSTAWGELRAADNWSLALNRPQAEKALEEALRRFVKWGEKRGRLEALTRLCPLLMAQNRIDEAAGHIETLRQGIEQFAATPLAGKILRETARFDLRQSRTREAAQALEDALALFQEHGETREEAMTRSLVALFLRDHGMMDEGWKQFEQGLGLLWGDDRKAEQAALLMDQGDFAARWGEIERARKSFDAALAIYRKLEEVNAIAHARHALFELEAAGPDSTEGSTGSGPGDCRGSLIEAARAFRRGLDGEGGAALTRLIDCVLNQLGPSGGGRLDHQRINPSLQRILEAQKKGDLVGLADELEYGLGEVLP